MRALLDTCVISEIARTGGTERVRQRVAALRAEDTFLSVITLGEIVHGIARLPRSKKRTALEGFLDRMERDFASRIVGIDIETARIWGELTARASSRGQIVPPTDGLIAASALRHGLHVMTRNVSDFAPTGALILNPWDDA